MLRSLNGSRKCSHGEYRLWAAWPCCLGTLEQAEKTILDSILLHSTVLRGMGKGTRGQSLQRSHLYYPQNKGVKPEDQMCSQAL